MNVQLFSRYVSKRLKNGCIPNQRGIHDFTKKPETKISFHLRDRGRDSWRGILQNSGLQWDFLFSQTSPSARFSNNHPKKLYDNAWRVQGQIRSCFTHRIFLKIKNYDDIRHFGTQITSYGASKTPIWVIGGGEEADTHPCSRLRRVSGVDPWGFPGRSTTYPGVFSLACGAPMPCGAGSSNS